jgi:hypothetical protein
MNVEGAGPEKKELTKDETLKAFKRLNELQMELMTELSPSMSKQA